MVRNKERLIKAAYTYSQELGKEVETLANAGASPERIRQLSQLANEEFGEDAGLVYDTVLFVLYPPN